MNCEFKDKKLLIVCNTFRGRRLKFYELQQRLFDRNNILILAGHDVPGYDNLMVYHNLDQLRELAQKFDPDIVHCNIDNSAPAKVIRESGSYPVVIDSHDYSMLRGIADESAKQVYEAADFVIFVNDELSKVIRLNFKIADNRCVVINSMVPRSWMVKERLSVKRNTIVNIGSMAKSVAYRNIDDILAKLAVYVDDIHNYAPVGGSQLNYVVKHEPIFNKRLYQEISQYEIGLLACKITINELDRNYFQQYGLSNRVFDYVSARIPTLAINMGDYIDSFVGQWGVCIKDHYDFKQAIDDTLDKEIDYDYWQERLCLDNYFDQIKMIYESVVR